MAWVTGIVDDEQVEYRLSGHAGCYVALGADSVGMERPDDGASASALPHTDAQLGLRADAPEAAERPGAALAWIGEGLRGLHDACLVPGGVLDEDGKRAARALAAGVHPVTGERLVTQELRAHPRAKLTGARLVEAIDAHAQALGRTSSDELFEGKPKQARQYATLARMVRRKGERHRLQVDSLHRIARAAGLALEDIYDAAELARARAHEGKRVSVRIRAYDLVADLPKSDSVLWALMNKPGHEREFRALVHQAKREAFAQIERWIGYGLAGEDGELHRIATGGLLGWSVEHQSARPVDETPGDPHLHVHIVIINMARCQDGVWRAVANGGMDLHRHARVFDALFKGRVRALAQERFGVRYAREARTGAWEVVGIPTAFRDHYSRRAAQVDALAGEEASRADKLRVSTRTRHAKHDAGELDLRAVWRGRARDLGYDVDALVAAAAPGPDGGDLGGALSAGGPEGPRTPSPVLAFTGEANAQAPTPAVDRRVPSPKRIAAEVFDPEHGLTADDKEFTYAQLLAAVAHACPYGVAPHRLKALAERVLAVEGYAVALPPRGSVVMSHTARYTTRDILEAEQTVVDQARARYADGSVRLTAGTAQAVIGVFEATGGVRLAAEQQRAVERLLTAGHGVDAVIGAPGSGRTSVLEACRIGWDAAGGTCAGACVSEEAARNLYEESGIPAQTVAYWLRRITGQSQPGLAGIDVLVLDEAAMTDDRALAVLLAEAARTRTKVVAAGDPQRSRAIGPGGGFAEAHRLVGGEVLTVNRRQKDAGERAALEVWRSGDRARALELLAQRGRVHTTDTADEARTGILSAWDAVRSQASDAYELIDRLVLLATRNDDVDALNTGAQALLRAAGELGAGHRYALPGGTHLTLAAGDVVRLHVGDFRRGRGAGPDVLTGYRAVVAGIDADYGVIIRWRRSVPGEGGRTVGETRLTADQITTGALSLGYAMTINASQGLICDTALVYGLGANAYALHPALTRARTASHLWLPVAAVEDPRTRAALGAARDEAELLERALDAYGSLLRQDRADTMVSDQLRHSSAPAAAARDAAAETTGVPAAFADVRSCQERPYGLLPHARLAADRARAVREAASVEEAAGHRARAAHDMAAAPLPGPAVARAAATLLGRAEQLAGQAAGETAAAVRAEEEAEKARAIIDHIAGTTSRSRLALRLGGTSRAEQQALQAHYTREMARAEQESRRARTSATEATEHAWQLLANSPYADALMPQSTPSSPPPVGGSASPTPAVRPPLADHLAHLRSRILPTLAARLDAARAKAVQRARQESVDLRARLQELRTAAEEMSAELELRARIAAQAPRLHVAEAAARDLRLREERRPRESAAQRKVAAGTATATRAPAVASRPGSEHRGSEAGL